MLLVSPDSSDPNVRVFRFAPANMLVPAANLEYEPCKTGLDKGGRTRFFQHILLWRVVELSGCHHQKHIRTDRTS